MSGSTPSNEASDQTPDLSGRTVGLVGLGLMGVPMARQLRAAGATLRVWNRTREKAEALAEEIGATDVCACPRDVTDSAEATILMVSDADAVELVVFDPDENSYGIAQGLGADGLLIDMGTTSVLRTRDFADRLRQTGAEWLDAPVSGGTVAAESGTLTIMAGGGGTAFQRALPLFQAMGQRITHVGAVGAGQIAKSANQMIVGLTIGAVAEAFALARHAGVEPAKIREALFGGFAHSRILELHGQRMVDGDYAPRAKCSIQRKDIAEAVQLAESVDLVLPGLRANLTLWEHMVANGMADLDHSALLLAIDPNSREK
jgi:3-hydroxyisobutyrate dehydrogenase-like beta-hydroxyacid dehydrogenase